MRKLTLQRTDWNADMRVSHSFLEERVCRALKPGQAILRVNRRLTMCRLYDWRGCYTMWAPVGEVFSIRLIRQWMRDGIGVDLDNLKRDEHEAPTMAEIEASDLREAREFHDRRKRKSTRKRRAA